MHSRQSRYRQLVPVFFALFLATATVSGADTSEVMNEADQVLKTKDYTRARRLLEQACKEGSAVGCHNLALMFYKGDGGLRDETRARMFYARACRHGMGASCFNAGAMWEKGQGGEQDVLRARTFYREACARKFADGCEMEKILEKLARVEQQEKKVEADIKRADKRSGKVNDRLTEIDQEEKKIRKERERDVEELQRLKQKEKELEADLKRANEEAKEAKREAERADAAYEAAVALKAGDLKRARDLFDQACKAGNSGSCVHLGWMIGSGRGGPRDERRARTLLEQGCKAGVAEGCFALGAMFDDGVGGPQDKARARALYDQACKGGYAQACSREGKPAIPPPAGTKAKPAVPVDPERGREIFIDGLDAFSARDYPRARSLYEQACQAGSPTGCEYLGLMLVGGTGGPQDTARARELFDRTCKQGHVDSCVRLANMSKAGADVPREMERGRRGIQKPVPDRVSAEVKRTPPLVSTPQITATPPAAAAPRPSAGKPAQGSPDALARLPEPPQTPHKRCALDAIAGTYQTVYGPLVCKPGNGGLDCCYGPRCERKANLTLDESGQNMLGTWRYPDGKHGPLTFPLSPDCALRSGRWGDAGKNPDRAWTVGRR